jgi:hypothetical protein
MSSPRTGNGRQDSSVNKWLRNGRASLVVWLLVFGAWMAFQLAGIPVTSTFDQLLLLISGVLVGNLALRKEKQDNVRANKAKEFTEFKERSVDVVSEMTRDIEALKRKENDRTDREQS